MTTTLVKKAIERNKKRIEELKGADNPQLVTMRIKAEAKVEILEEVLWSLRGSHVMLKIEAGE